MIDPTSKQLTRSSVFALLGLPNAGKSTLLNKLVGDKVSIVSKKPQTTRLRVSAVRWVEDAELVFADTPGFLVGKGRRRALDDFMRGQIAEALESADFKLLIIDGRSNAFIGESLKAFRQAGLDAPRAVLLNKIDCLRREQLLPRLDYLAKAVDSTWESPGVEYFPVSAKSESGLKGLLSFLASIAEAGPPMFEPDTLSDQRESQFVAEVYREKLINSLHEELPHCLSVQVNHVESTEHLVRFSVEIVVERESQKGIVIGKDGEMLKKVGTAARAEIESCLGTKIVLEARVVVEADWSKTPEGLKRAGLIGS